MVLFGGANPKNTQVSKGGCAVALHRAVDRRAGARRRRGRQHQPDPRRRAGGGAAGMDSDPAEHRHRDAAGARPHAGQRGPARPGVPRAYCAGFERVLPYLLGETDGQPKDADWAAAITGVPAETIRALARRMAADAHHGDRVVVAAARRITASSHTGRWSCWPSALGQIGLPGGGFGFGYGSGAGIAERAARRSARRRWTTCNNPIERHDPGGAHLRLPAASGRAVTTSTASAAPIPTSGWSIGRAAIRSIIIRTPTSCGAPGSGPRPSSCTSRGGPRPRAMPTSCCRRPRRSSATTSAARGATASSCAMQRAIEPVGEARDDFAIFSELARRLGCASAYTRRPRRDGLAAPSLRAMPPAAPAPTRAALPDFDAFWQQGYLEIPAARRRIRAVRRFPRRSREAQAAHAVRPHRALFREDRGLRLRRLPAASDLDRAVGMARRRRSAATIRCISSRASRATGCTARWIAARSARAARSRAARPITINPADAEARGIRDGDVVRVLQCARRLPRRRGRQRRDQRRRGAALVRRLVRPGRRRRAGALPARQSPTC